ncbi:N-(5'-phosphoribosyl)anthranilate isomerase [Compostibacillus humi]|uniref:N-(5'-phosphoribosyl)anthranilate isomerase n=1 Tax=Compostibacillus humi TaxID=1245525 RepID=A0A8J2ZQ80_9BACI|nr:phosphoribosylanthranilate isomerase [Compostibacillus humi]GGH72417.1 N-(5'-phosphoribosyl)anthranilate isomerase [Compostibacillus humi]
MLVKICGITTSETAEAAAAAGADFIGFVFAASRRKITPERAKMIARSLSSSVKTVGVFVNETVEQMVNIAEYVGLDYLQLHGDEGEAVSKQLPRPVIKAFSVKDKSIKNIMNYPCDYYLIDSPGGGTGKSFDWKLLDKFNLDASKLILAGGLNPENVQEAIRVVKPAGVDVSSGVETNGAKDIKKIKQFIHATKNERKDEKIDSIYNA